MRLDGFFFLRALLMIILWISLIQLSVEHYFEGDEDEEIDTEEITKEIDTEEVTQEIKKNE